MALTPETLLKLSLLPAVIFDEQLEIIGFNSLFEELCGYAQADKNTMDLQHIYHGYDLHKLVVKLKHNDVYFSHFELTTKDGRTLPACANMAHDDTNHIIMIIQPQGDDTLADTDRDFQAFHDPLTSLPNRLLLHKRIDQAMVECSSKSKYAAILFVDLDEFKPINDIHGHKCGDHVLIKIADRMQQLVRQQDTVARIGGDEFVLVCTGMLQPVHAGLTAKRLIHAIIRPIAWQDDYVHVSASVGISIIPNDGNTADELLRKADTAMYLAKNSGKNGYAFYDEDTYFE